MKIFIIIFEICELLIVGFGEIFGDNVFIVNDVELQILGFGDMDLVMEGDDFEVVIIGFGNIKLEGIVDELDLKIIGLGDIFVFDMDVF